MWKSPDKFLGNTGGSPVDFGGPPKSDRECSIVSAGHDSSAISAKGRAPHQWRSVTGRRPVLSSIGWALALMFGCVANTFADAKPPASPPDPAAHTVIVPYDLAKPLHQQKASRYYLDRDSFERLWKLAKENRKPELPVDATDKPAAVLHSAMYRVAIEDEQVVIEAKFEIGTRGRWAALPLSVAGDLSASVVARDWRVDDKSAALAEGRVLFENPGHHVVEAVFEQKKTSNWRDLKLTLPQAAASFASLVVPATDGRPEIEGAELMTEDAAGGQRIFTAVLGNRRSLTIQRGPKRPLDDDGLPAVADVDLIIGHTLGGADSIFADARFQFPGTERSRFALMTDANIQIASWTVRQGGRDLAVRSWASREEQGTRVIEFEFDQPAADEAQVLLWGSRKGGGGSQRSPLLEARATKGQQTIALLHDETVELQPQPTSTQRRIEKPAALDPSMLGARGKVSAIYYRLQQGGTLGYTVTAADLKWEAKADYVFQLSAQKQEMMAAIVLKRGLGSWSQVRIGLPAQFEIQSVAGPSLTAWKQEGGDLFLQFNPATTGAEARLVIYLAKSIPQPQAQWPIEPLRFSGFKKIEGAALIAAHAATEAQLVGFAPSQDFSETDPRTVTDVFTIAPPLEKKRALKFQRGNWSAVVAIAKQPVRFSADAVVLAQATDAGLLVSQQVGFYVEQGALDRVTVKLPASLPEATVKGDGLRETRIAVNGGMREYDCSFQSEVLSQAALTFDMPLPLGDELSLPFVEVVNAERLRRFFVLDNSSKRESRVLAANGVETAAKSSLPFIPAVLSQPAFYRGHGGSGELRVGYRELQSTEGHAAIVGLADITSVWRADGERWDTVIYSIYNRSLQFLPVVLPDTAELIAVAVGGEAVRADEQIRSDGKRARLIPLIQTRSGQRSLEVKLIYRVPAPPDPAPHQLPAVLRMDDPELLGISAERTVWTAIVPRRFTVAKVDGNMEEVTEESKTLEKLQGYMADLGRINRALSSFALSYSKEEGESALREAQQLAKQIEDETAMVDSRSRDKAEAFRKSKSRLGIDGDADRRAALQSQVALDLGSVKQELGKQQDVLMMNAGVIAGQTGQVMVDQRRDNYWNFNTAAGQQGRQIESLDARGAAGVAEQAGRLVAVNDNVLVSGGFLEQPAVSKPQPADAAKTVAMPAVAATDGAFAFAGTIVGTGTLAKVGGGSLTLSGANTYTGSASIQVGTTFQMAGVGGVPAQNEVTAQTQAANNARANVIVQLQAGGAGFGAGQPVPVVGAAAQTIDGLTRHRELLREEDKKMMAQLPAAMRIPPTAGADRPSVSDPLAAVAAPAPRGVPQAQTAARSAAAGEKTEAGLAAAQAARPSVQFGLEAQVSNQLRVTGRRSLMIEVPTDGTAHHFRKLKDHAVLELRLRKSWTSDQKQSAVWLGAGLAAYLIIGAIARKRRNRA